MIKPIVAVAAVVATFTLLQDVASAQMPLWRDGSSESIRQQLDDWRETARRDDLRERARTDRVRDLHSAERQWRWTERTAPVALFDGPPERHGQRR